MKVVAAIAGVLGAVLLVLLGIIVSITIMDSSENQSLFYIGITQIIGRCKMNYWDARGESI